MIALDLFQAHYQVLLIIYMIGLHSDKCADCKSCVDWVVFKNDQLIIRCFKYKKNYKKDFNKKLTCRFANIYEFCNGDINKFIILLRTGVFPYEYMGSWERFDETSLPDKKASQSKSKTGKYLDMQKECWNILIIKIYFLIKKRCLFFWIHE